METGSTRPQLSSTKRTWCLKKGCSLTSGTPSHFLCAGFSNWPRTRLLRGLPLKTDSRAASVCASVIRWKETLAMPGSCTSMSGSAEQRPMQPTSMMSPWIFFFLR